MDENNWQKSYSFTYFNWIHLNSNHIPGLDKLTDGRVYARHFPMHPEPLLNLPKWLAFWLERGAIPVATLNLQRNVRPVPDAWHHQMVFGVGPEGVYLTNPLECVEPELLWPQLCSESVLMVKREDVLARWTPQEFEKLMTVGDIRWRRLNVVGEDSFFYCIYFLCAVSNK